MSGRQALTERGKITGGKAHKAETLAGTDGKADARVLRLPLSEDKALRQGSNWREPAKTKETILATNKTQAAKLLNAAEMEVFNASLAPAIKELEHQHKAHLLDCRGISRTHPHDEAVPTDDFLWAPFH